MVIGFTPICGSLSTLRLKTASVSVKMLMFYLMCSTRLILNHVNSMRD
jgi:hypothetical protein